MYLIENAADLPFSVKKIQRYHKKFHKWPLTLSKCSKLDVSYVRIMFALHKVSLMELLCSYCTFRNVISFYREHCKHVKNLVKNTFMCLKAMIQNKALNWNKYFY